MIILHNLSLTMSGKPLFSAISCSFQQGQKIGLVGKNGAGKSTLLKVLAGLQGIDEGSFSIEKGKKIGYMPQDVVMQSTQSTLNEALSVFARFIAIRAELDGIEQALEREPHDVVAIERYAELQEELIGIDADALQVRARNILTGLGFSAQQLEQPVNELSLGWRMRLVLAKLLLQDADFYFFDEPTNHLDLMAKEWFVQFLKNASFGYLLVSHDRFFLDTVCDYTFELDRGNGTWYRGNYTSFLEQKAANRERLQAAYEAQQREIKKKEDFVERFKAKASSAKRAQSVAKALDKIERIELESDAKEVKISFPEVERPGRVVLTVHDVAKSFTPQTTLFKHATFELFRDDKAALVAANGKGKSTLLSIVMGKLKADSGTVAFGHKVEPAFFEQDQAAVLNPNKTILEEIEDACSTSQQRARVRTMLGTFLFPGDDVYKKTGVLSGGEKNRVAMVKVLLQKANVLFLDEPTNHLDLQSKEILLKALQAYTGTILFVSHDRDFLNKLATKIFELTSEGVIAHEGNFDAFIYHKEMQQKALEQTKTTVQQRDATVTTSRPIEPKKNTLSYEEQKNMARIERKIEKLEHELALAQQAYAHHAYGTAAYHDNEKKIAQLKKDIAYAMAEWEDLHIRTM